MFLTIHAAAGASLSILTTNPLIAFILGFISHFILDAIPHGDEHIDQWTTKYSFKQRIAVIALIDFGVASFILGTALPELIIAKPLIILFGMAGGVMPDIIQGIVLGQSNFLAKTYTKIHLWFHKLSQIKIPLSYGLLLQGLILCLLIYPLIN